jgi:hypothetical protein
MPAAIIPNPVIVLSEILKGSHYESEINTFKRLSAAKLS